MAHPLLYSNTADRLLSALCDTLLHSLWQGIILAAVAGLIVIGTRKATSALRYNLLVSALLLFAIGVGVTFAWQYESIPVSNVAMSAMPHTNVYAPHVNVEAQPVNINPQPVRVFVDGKPQAVPGFTERWGSFLSGHHNTIVFIWFLIVCARSLQLAFGLYGTYRLRRVRVFSADRQWVERLQQLADSLNIKQAVKLLESGIAKVPMVIGHLKPVILVPVGLLTALSADEVEAILIHELAHIKRRDYLVNMLQSLVEIVLFFNPAVLWVSKLIKTERENCCDDLALAQNNNKLSYIRALVSCEEYQASVPAYAMGFPGGKNTLLDRVKRMATNRNYSLNLVEKAVLAVCLVVLGLGVSAFTAREDIKKAVKSIVSAIHHDAAAQKAKPAKSDTTKKRSATPSNDVNGLLNQLQLLHPDTLKTTGSPELDALVRKIDSLKVTNSQLSGLNGNLSGFKGSDNPLSQLGKSDTNLMKLLAPNQQSIQATNRSRDVGRELYREHLITDTNHLSITTHLDKRELIVNGVRMPDDVYQKIYEKYYKKGENNSYGINYDNGNSYGRNYASSGPGRYPYNATGGWEAQERSRKIGNELVGENLVKDNTRFTYKLSKDELSIDGVRQPEELHRRIVDEFFKPGDGFNISYSYQDPGTISQATNAHQLAEVDRSAEMAPVTPTSKTQRSDGDEKTQSIIRDMLKDNIITSDDDLSFKIGTTEFVVNYKKQPEAIYQKYRAKYVPKGKKGDWIWFYQFDTNKWDQIEGRKSSEDFHGTATGVFQGKEDGNSGGNKIGYSGGYNDGDYNRKMEPQKKYWDDRQWKLMDEVKRDGLANNHIVYSFSLSDKQFVINGVTQSDEVFKKYYREYAPANPGPNWVWSYQNHWDAHSDSLSTERNRIEAERDKKLVTDLLQDGLITDANNVTFTMTDKKLTINGKKQSDEVYKKYKDKYLPDNNGGTWSWTYGNHQ